MNRRDFLKLLPASLGSLLYLRAFSSEATEQEQTANDPTTYQPLLQQQPLAGYQYYQADKVWPELRIGDELEMCRERENMRDANAIEIYWRNRKLGYVPRDKNADLARRMDQGEKVQARIIGLTESEDQIERIEMGFYRVKT